MTTTPLPATASTAAAASPTERGHRLRRVAAGGSIVGAGVLTLAGYLTCPWEGGATQAEYIRSLTEHPARRCCRWSCCTSATCCWCPRPSSPVFAALRAGARGYLLKEADAGEIARAVRAVADGEAVSGARVADQVLRFFSAAGATAALTPFPQLTAREREVLALVAQGRDNATIARRLFLSDKTVRNHVSACLAKLQVATRAEAVALARDAGLGAPR